jgi:hypothetical protein
MLLQRLLLLLLDSRPAAAVAAVAAAAAAVYASHRRLTVAEGLQHSRTKNTCVVQETSQRPQWFPVLVSLHLQAT